MKPNFFKKKLDDIKPHLKKIALNTAQGYVFGCMVGLFTTKNTPKFSDIHYSGKRLANVCACYSATESLLSVIRKKDDAYNSLISGVVTGGLNVSGGFSKSSLLGAAAFGMYSGINGLSMDKNEKK